jgi:Glutaminase/Cyclic nucleotide-binding domain
LDQATSVTGTMEEVGAASASPIEDFLIDLHQRISDVGGGKVADYIPELGRADADTFGMALATVDGETYATGDADQLFTIQSVSKPFMYGYALQLHQNAEPKFALSELDVFKGLNAEEYRLVETIVNPLIFEKGEVIIREGDQAKLFFVLARGSVSVLIRIPTQTGEKRRRVASIGPGLTFGEMALFGGGARSADVRVAQSSLQAPRAPRAR